MQQLPALSTPRMGAWKWETGDTPWDGTGCAGTGLAVLGPASAGCILEGRAGSVNPV